MSTAVVDNGYNPDNPALTLTGPGGLGLLPQGLPGTNVVHAYLYCTCSVHTVRCTEKGTLTAVHR